jgi:hypothetical protein
MLPRRNNLAEPSPAHQYPHRKILGGWTYPTNVAMLQTFSFTEIWQRIAPFDWKEKGMDFSSQLFLASRAS